MRKRRSSSIFNFKSIQYKLKSFWKKKHTINVFIVVWLLLLVGFWYINIRNKLYSSVYSIDRITYTKNSLLSYNDSMFYNDISLLYLCRSYSDVKIFWDNVEYVKVIKEKYPFVDTVQIKGFANNTLWLEITFVKPIMRFLYKDTLYGAYSDDLIKLRAEDSIWFGLPLILLPWYLQNSSASVSGLLYNLDMNKMLYDVLLLKSIPLSWTITYIPGWDKYIYSNDSLRVYFNAKKNILSQIVVLSTLMTQYRGFDKLQQIDVGSLDTPIIK